MSERIRISDEIIELAKQHPEKEKEIYWAAVIYALEWRMVYSWLAEYLDPNLRRSKNMKWKQNRVGQTKNKRGTDLNLRVGHTNKKNKSGTHLKNKARTTKKQISEEALTIYIRDNKQLYDIVYRFICSNMNTWNIQYLINSQWEQNYIYTQMKEAEKIIEKVWLETFMIILAFIKQDDFRNKQILTIAKLNRKNKDGVPYYVVIMDLIKNFKPKVVSIPTV